VVQQIAVFRSSGFSLLDQAAVAAVRGWLFEPASRNGFPVAARVEVPVHFVLE
jgi:protein TonB